MIQTSRSLFVDLVRKTLEDERWGRLALAVFDLVREILKKRRRKIAIIADDVFQAIGLDKAAAYVKGLLNMIEHPVYNYESIVVLIATSEGISREEIGRHRWAHLRPMWNMPREGLQQLYDRIPGAKPPFEGVWRWTGGNPEMLVKLYRSGWAVERVVGDVLRGKRLTAEFVRRWGKWLEVAVEDPDVVGKVEFPHELRQELVWRNLIIYIYRRGPALWVDEPPPERNPELGVGKNVAWQTPLHREAVRRAVREAASS
jgi:hypothetical protein